MKVKLLDGAFLPIKAHETDAGYDLFARDDFVVPPSKSAFGGKVDIGCYTHDTGVCIELPMYTVGMIKSKSGLNVNYGLTSEGVIDCGYTGSIRVKLYNHTSHPYEFKRGDKISQLVIMPICESKLQLAKELGKTKRGNGGFGSTGK